MERGGVSNPNVLGQISFNPGIQMESSVRGKHGSKHRNNSHYYHNNTPMERDRDFPNKKGRIGDERGFDRFVDWDRPNNNGTNINIDSNSHRVVESIPERMFSGSNNRFIYRAEKTGGVVGKAGLEHQGQTVQRVGGALLDRFGSIEREREEEYDHDPDLPKERFKEEELIDREPVQVRDKDDSEGVQQELVAQYKLALGELTFNSKPIITNLTIIAGENSHAAKGIAAIVCSHIAEVSNEQKLPSLYLLDSIVKNIGGDYMKYFAAQLPKVFCKAYKQIDPGTHPAMQHLFQTWRGVFPPTPLRAIETELQLPPAVNGPSGPTISRPSSSQSQCPGRRIHVNPKYLEARQHLQQSSTEDTVDSEAIGESPIDEAERLERAMHESPQDWSETPKRASERGDDFSEPEYEREPSIDYADYNFGPVDASLPETRVLRSNGRFAEQDDGWERHWYGRGDRKGLGQLESSATSATDGQWNVYDWLQLSSPCALIDAYGNYRGTRSARGLPPDLQPLQGMDSRNNRSVSRNWKNSEEEEYMWEDINPRAIDDGRGNDNTRKDGWFPGGADKMHGLGKGDRMGLGPALPENSWGRQGSLSHMDRPREGDNKFPQRRGLEGRFVSYPLPGAGAGSINDTFLETSSQFHTKQTASVDRPLPGKLLQLPRQHQSPPPQSRHRTLQVAVPSHTSPTSSLAFMDLGQSGCRITVSPKSAVPTSMGLLPGRRTSFRSVIGTSCGTDVLSSGDISPMTPTSTGLHFPLQHQAQRPLSQNPHLSIKHLTVLPSSVLPHKSHIQAVQHEQQCYSMKPGHSQIQASSIHPQQMQQSQPAQTFQWPSYSLQPLQPIPQLLHQMQQVPRMQTAHESFSQLPYHLTQSGHGLQQSQNSQQMQLSPHAQDAVYSEMPVHHGHQMQSLQHSQPARLLQQIQPSPLSLQTQSQPLVQSRPLQQSHLQSQLQTQTLNYAPPQAQPMGSTVSGISIKTDLASQSQSTSSLLKAFLQSALFPSSNPQPLLFEGSVEPTDSESSQPLLHIQPPLPNGPPPAVSLPAPPAVPLPGTSQMAFPVTSFSGPDAGSALAPPSFGNNSMFSSQSLQLVQPPLPPGPPPPSSLLGSSSQPTSSVAAQPAPLNPLSNLLNSLVAQGLISAPKELVSSVSQPTVSLAGTPSVPIKTHNQITGLVPSNPVQDFPGNLFVNGAISVPATSIMLPISPSTGITPEPTPDKSQAVQDPIGTEFRQDIIRKRHESVINALYYDIPRQCKTCGLRFNFQEEHSKHMDWHVSRNRRQKLQKKVSRNWFVSVKEWLSGTGVSASEAAAPFFEESSSSQTDHNEEAAVPADENQNVCALCGELFEDFYSDKTEEWMYKGAVYMNAPPGRGTNGLDSSLLGPIVHAKCRSESAAVSLADSEEDTAGK